MVKEMRMLSNESLINKSSFVGIGLGKYPIEASVLTGREFILLVEDHYNRATSKTLQLNPFWRAMINDPMQISESVFHGMCIENYQLLCRESYFDAPALSFPSNRAVRTLLNEFYCEEIGHDRILLEALNSIGITELALHEAIPLRGTMALCNSLSYWARHDPLFFMTTLGPLEGRDVDVDSFVRAGEEKGLPEEFLGPIRKHAHINRDSAHGLLTREIFAKIPTVSRADTIRVLGLTDLFISIYDQFYLNVWTHYSKPEVTGHLLRGVTAI
jgi:hypothetical protein